MALQTFEKQPAEVKDIDFSFVDWLAARDGVSATTADTAAETGLTIVSSVLTAGVVKVIVSGGTDATKYKVTVKLNTDTPLIREADCYVKVKAL